MTSYICPFARYVEQTFYPNGNIKTEIHAHSLGKLATVGIPMAADAAAVNGLVAYISGENPLAASAMGGVFAFGFCLSDLIGHQLRGEQYH